MNCWASLHAPLHNALPIRAFAGGVRNALLLLFVLIPQQETLRLKYSLGAILLHVVSTVLPCVIIILNTTAPYPGAASEQRPQQPASHSQCRNDCEPAQDSRPYEPSQDILYRLCVICVRKRNIRHRHLEDFAERLPSLLDVKVIQPIFGCDSSHIVMVASQMLWC